MLRSLGGPMGHNPEAGPVVLNNIPSMPTPLSLFIVSSASWNDTELCPHIPQIQIIMLPMCLPHS